MPYLPDLAGNRPVKEVGYLWCGHSYATGKIDELVFERLVTIVEKPLGEDMGFHTCNLGLCGATPEPRGGQLKFRYRDRTLFLGSSEIYVPDDEVVYCTPNLILHYIRDHSYRPPECFCAAVLKCPAPDTEEYGERLRRIIPRHPVVLFAFGR
jgi:hypothetical protein